MCSLAIPSTDVVISNSSYILINTKPLVWQAPRNDVITWRTSYVICVPRPTGADILANLRALNIGLPHYEWSRADYAIIFVHL